MSKPRRVGVYSHAQNPRCHLPACRLVMDYLLLVTKWVKETKKKDKLTMWVEYPASLRILGSMGKPVGTPPALRGFRARCWRPRW